MSILEKRIQEIVDENFILARALQFLGVDFYENRFETLEEICQARDISHQKIVRSFYQFDAKTRIPLKEIDKFPAELVIEYLKYAHYSYVKNFLPYISSLISRIPDDSETTSDLKEVFPLFVEDFIHHIYEEEDEIFGWINHLIHCNSGNAHHFMSYEKDKVNLTEVHQDHQADDEMKGMRNLVSLLPKNDLLLNVVRKEISAFDQELAYHATVENEILFPKAIRLQKKIERKVLALRRFN